jgi:hypothetical protein
VLQDGDVYRMWYRGHRYIIDTPPLRQAQGEVVCYAESKDGIHWEKPKLGLFEFNGSKDNNIVWLGGPEAHNFAPFLDRNPACPKEQRFKAIGGTITSKGLLTFYSEDGIHWHRLSETPVVTEGAFDSHNTCFWDAQENRYTMYVRYFSEAEFKGLRSIGVAFSKDFTTWTKPVGLTYPDSPPQQMYTNQIGPYYRAPQVLFGIPTRYVHRPLTEYAKRLEPVKTRAQFVDSVSHIDAYTGAEITDGVFMTSRDGLAFHRWDEAFLRPGPQSLGRWIYGDNYQAYGLLETNASREHAPREISLFFDEGAWRDDQHLLRRYTIRRVPIKTWPTLPASAGFCQYHGRWQRPPRVLLGLLNKSQKFWSKYHHAKYWPHPYNCEDRAYINNILAQQSQNGWQSATTLHEMHFDPETHRLNSSGEAQLRWILLQVPPQYRSVFVAQAFSTEASQFRADQVRQYAELVCGANVPPIMLKYDDFNGRPAIEIDTLRRLELQSIPQPRLFTVGSASGSNSSSSPSSSEAGGSVGTQGGGPTLIR